METMNKWMYGLLGVAILLGCGESTSSENEVVEKEISSVEVGKVTAIENLFDETTFPDPMHEKLLRELNICDSVRIEGSPVSPCAPNYFKIMPFYEDRDINDAFLLQIRALATLKGQIDPLPMRHLIAFERENGTLVKVNGFRGNLIERRTSDSGVDDLVIRFYIPEDGAFLNCLFTWNGDQFKFQSVEAIDGGGGTGAVKEALKDSISKEVYQSLMLNGMLF